MKIEKENQTITSIVQKSTYICEYPGCDYKTTDKEAADNHHGAKHAVKDTKQIFDYTFHLFETEDDARQWMDAADGSRIQRVRWSGPGWYRVSHYTQPCPRSCCTDDVVELTSYPECVKDWQSDLCGIMYTLEEAAEKLGPCSTCGNKWEYRKGWDDPCIDCGLCLTPPEDHDAV